MPPLISDGHRIDLIPNFDLDFEPKGIKISGWGSSHGNEYSKSFRILAFLPKKFYATQTSLDYEPTSRQRKFFLIIKIYCLFF